MKRSPKEGAQWRALSDVLAEHSRREDQDPLMPRLTSGIARNPGGQLFHGGDRRRPRATSRPSS